MPLDYLSYTIRPGKYPEKMLPLHDAFDLQVPIEPFHGRYNKAYRLVCGGVFTYNDQREDIYPLVVLSGEPLGEIRAMGFDDDSLVNDVWIKTTGGLSGNITRADFCLDTDDKKSQVIDFKRAWDNGKIKTRCRTADYIDRTERPSQGVKKKPAETFYLGSKESDRMLRVYDKASELKLLNQILNRVELQTRNDCARALVKDSCLHGADVAGKAHIRKFCQVDIPWFNRLLRGENIAVSKIPRKEPKFRRWLNGQVKSAIMNNMDEHREFIQHWLYTMTVLATQEKAPYPDIDD